MKTFIACLLIIGAAYIYKKIHTYGNASEASREDQQAQKLSFFEIESSIDELTHYKQQLLEIENMITDIESCAPDECATAFNISTPTSNSSLVLLANRNSECILNLLYSEREICRSSIVKIIQNLSERCNGNVTETTRETVCRGVIENE